ncbi:MAG: hypothetical protein ACPGSM_02305 [Thiolinea sp.]
MIRFLSFVLVAVALFLIYKGALLLLKKDVQQGIQRLAYSISGLWIGVPFLVIWAQNRWSINSIDQDEWLAWLLLAVLPNIVFWALIWVLKGFRNDEEDAV